MGARRGVASRASHHSAPRRPPPAHFRALESIAGPLAAWHDILSRYRARHSSCLSSLSRSRVEGTQGAFSTPCYAPPLPLCPLCPSDPDPPTNFPSPKAATPSPQPPLLDLVYIGTRGKSAENVARTSPIWSRCNLHRNLLSPSNMAEFVRAQIFGTTFEITSRYGTSRASPYGKTIV